MKNIIVSFCFLLCLLPFALTAQPGELSAAFQKSYQQESVADYKGSIETLKKVYAAEHYELNLRLGYLHYLSGLFNESMTYYNKSITLKPGGIEARLGFVLPASALGNWDKVETQYKRILEIDPQNTVVNYREGLILYGRKDYQNAFKNFEVVVNMYPFGYDALLMYGWTYLQLGKYREARQIFNKVLLCSPNDKSALEGISLLK